MGLWNPRDFMAPAILRTLTNLRTIYFHDAHRHNPFGVQWAVSAMQRAAQVPPFLEPLSIDVLLNGATTSAHIVRERDQPIRLFLSAQAAPSVSR
jgi:hypothetical protein